REGILEAILLRGGNQPVDIAPQPCRHRVAQTPGRSYVLRDGPTQRRVELHGIGNVGAGDRFPALRELREEWARRSRGDRAAATRARAEHEGRADDRGHDASLHAENLATGPRVASMRGVAARGP